MNGHAASAATLADFRHAAIALGMGDQLDVMDPATQERIEREALRRGIVSVRAAAQMLDGPDQ